jgi:hypothetical protein
VGAFILTFSCFLLLSAPSSKFHLNGGKRRSYLTGRIWDILTMLKKIRLPLDTIKPSTITNPLLSPEIFQSSPRYVTTSHTMCTSHDATTFSHGFYTKSPSSSSAVIQLYARSGQLDTALHLSSRLKEGLQHWCRFGCQQIEDRHHILLQCPKFISLQIHIPID